MANGRKLTIWPLVVLVAVFALLFGVIAAFPPKDNPLLNATAWPTAIPTVAPTATPPFYTRTPAEQKTLDVLLGWGWKYLVLKIPRQWSWNEHENDPMGVFYRVWNVESQTWYAIRFEHNLATEYLLKDREGAGRIDYITESWGLMPDSSFEEMLDLSGADWTLSRPADDAPPSYVGTAFFFADRIVEAIQESREADKTVPQLQLP